MKLLFWPEFASKMHFFCQKEGTFLTILLSRQIFCHEDAGFCLKDNTFREIFYNFEIEKESFFCKKENTF